MVFQAHGIQPTSKLERLQFLRAELGIQPVTPCPERITELTERYADYLILPDEPDDA